MIVIAPTGNPLETANQLVQKGFEVGIYGEGRYLRAYPTTVAVES